MAEIGKYLKEQLEIILGFYLIQNSTTVHQITGLCEPNMTSINSKLA